MTPAENRREWLAAENPVAIFSNGYGDHLVNLPALRALAGLFPGRLTLICQTGARDSFFHELALRTCCEVDMEIAGRGKLFDVESVVEAVTATGPCDLLLSLNPWHSPAIDRLLELLGRPRSIGFHPPFDVVLERDFSKHSSELAFDVPRCLDRSLRLDDFGAPPEFPRRFGEEAERILGSLPPGARALTVHTDTEERKMWPAGRFVEVLDRLLDRHPDLYVLDVGEKDLQLSCGRHGGRVLSLCGIALPVAVLLVAKSSFFLGVDSCFLHAADLWRVPGVGLFGPTDPVEWGFRFGPGRHVCGGGAMETIEVDEVLEALESLIQEDGAACAGVPAADRPHPAGKEATL
ncbi:MAG TPA: glycosyltransferase family 9 protein [Thermoanaerobaculia bacterium]|nr:glycosyltransferase family 9 protein [Thermoanaerobaculia bacterium]